MYAEQSRSDRLQEDLAENSSGYVRVVHVRSISVRTYEVASRYPYDDAEPPGVKMLPRHQETSAEEVRLPPAAAGATPRPRMLLVDLPARDVQSTDY